MFPHPSQRSAVLAKARYIQAKLDAMRVAAQNVQIKLAEAEVTAPSFRLGLWSGSSEVAYRDQWLRDCVGHGSGVVTEWNWIEIFRRHREFDSLALTLWSDPEVLCGLSLVTASSRSVNVRFLEGRPDPGCPLIGLRALICIEAAMCYGQTLGKSEIVLTPTCEEVAAIYVDELGFQAATRDKVKVLFRPL